MAYGVRMISTLLAGILAMQAGAAAAENIMPTTRAMSVPALMREALVPGLQMAFIDGRNIKVLPFGMADVQTRTPVTSDTVFEAASLSKPVFAYAVMRLATEGRIDLDAPIGRYDSDLPPALARVTPRQLLSHSAGLPNSPQIETPTVEVASPPRFSYSGEGYNLLQGVVEKITGDPTERMMERLVFEPLGMVSSSYIWRDDYRTRKAFGHGYTGNSAGRNRIKDARVASSLETTAGDYARFLLAAVAGRGIRSDLARDFLRAQVPLEDGCVECLGKPRMPPSNRRFWSLGFGLEETGNRRIIWHFGDNQTMQSYAAVDKTTGRGLVILTNSANGHSIVRQLASSQLSVDAPGYAWAATYTAYTDPARRVLTKIVRSGTSSLSTTDLALPQQELVDVAEKLISGGRPADAADLARRLIERGKPTASTFVLLAEAERKSGEFPQARAAAAAALRLEPASAKARQALTRIEQTERVIPHELLDQYSGRYSSPYGELEIRREKGHLTAQLPDQPPSELLPLDDHSFTMEAWGVPIEFIRDAIGVVTHAVVRAGGEQRLPKLRART